MYHTGDLFILPVAKCTQKCRVAFGLSTEIPRFYHFFTPGIGIAAEPAIIPSMNSIHEHPQPALNKLIHYGGVVLIAVMLAATVAQVIIALAEPRAVLLLMGAILTLLLMLPVVMLVTITPPVTVSPDALTLRPVIGKPIQLAWTEIAAIKPYPLLPPQDNEITRRALVGPKRYRPAEGTMLVIPSLPLPYRVNGFFCGEGLTPVIAFTSRAHSDYDKLIKKTTHYFEESRA
jgi:hypothetical protein